MVDEAADAAHAIAVDDHTTAKVETVVVAFLRVLVHHPASEFSLTDHLSKVLEDELAYTQDALG